MKRTLLVSLALGASSLVARPGFAQFGGILQHVEDKVEQKTEEAIDKAMDQQDTTATTQNTTGQATNTASTSTETATTTTTGTSYAAYQNYDFQPGNSIIFEDAFLNDQDGEFPAHWKLNSGQAVVNKVQGAPAFLLTEGNYVLVAPRMKSESYLTDPFTVEFDYYQANSNAWAPMITFADASNASHSVRFGADVHTELFPHDLNGSVISSDQFYGTWHHAALIYKSGQMKVYTDNLRSLVIPNVDFVPVSLQVGGVSDPNNPITFRNFRIASGGDANALGTLLTNGKYVTHGITFDVGSARLKPESMGVLNQMAAFMKSNAVKLEIDGHTDNDGDAAANQKLSQARADAVKAQLVTMGVDASRLTTKGFGASKPLGANDTPEGKANNRRVEFVKK